LPFDELKIDRLFVSNIVADDKARAIARSLISMGNEARVAVVAEGVETADELRLLMDLGCSQVQGYALSHPITLSKLLEFQQVSVTPVAR
jgi:EAL domain-containing protein (putative c-di-GMP-specific phosphodiesterase class I)